VLPDGRALLFTRRGQNAQDDVTMVRQFDSSGSRGEARMVSPGQGAYSAGHVVFPRGDALYAQPFDLVGLDAKEQPRPLGIPVYRVGGAARFSVNAVGTLLVLSSPPSARSHAWFDRQGRRGENVGPEGEYGGFDVTSRGERIVTSENLNVLGSLWVIDAARATRTRLTFGDQYQSDVDPNVTADGTVFFVRRGVTNVGLYQIAIDGGPERQLRDRTVFSLDDVTDDGRWLVYRKSGAALEAWASPVASAADELAMRADAPVAKVHLSPDRRWAAYNTAAEGGRQEVYVISRSAANARWLVSAGGGVQPIWRSDGRELFYLGLDGTLYAVVIDVGEAVLKPGAPRALFKSPLRGVSGNVEQYRATADGQRFLFKVPVGDEVQPPLHVILNWPGLLDRQEPAKP
jgi:eukaryotic-like serine/threonine-protein kinase